MCPDPASPINRDSELQRKAGYCFSGVFSFAALQVLVVGNGLEK